MLTLMLLILNISWIAFMCTLGWFLHLYRTYWHTPKWGSKEHLKKVYGVMLVMLLPIFIGCLVAGELDQAQKSENAKILFLSLLPAIVVGFWARKLKNKL